MGERGSRGKDTEEIRRTLDVYGDFAGEVFGSIRRLEPKIHSPGMQTDTARAINLYFLCGSGCAALAMAIIRLRHFLAPEKEVFLLGNQARGPVRENDLATFFSRSGKRDDVLPHPVDA